MSIRGIKSAPAVTAPATTDALLVQQADGVVRYETVAQLLSLGSGSGGAAQPKVFASAYSNNQSLTTTALAIGLIAFRDKTGIIANGTVTIKVAGTYIISGFAPALDTGASGAPAAGSQVGFYIGSSVNGAGITQWTTVGPTHTTVRYDATGADFAAGEVLTLYALMNTGTGGIGNPHFAFTLVDAD